MAGYYASSGGFRTRKDREDVDPMASLGNISDAMLVFACGLLVALVVAYNVNISSVSQVEIDQSQEISQDIENLDLEGSSGNSYLERGKVYEDPRTGKLYMLEETTTGDAVQNASSGASTGNTMGTK